MALGLFGFSEERNEVVDFATYLSIDFFQPIVTQKKPELNPWGFLFPYSLWLWIGIFGSLLTMTILFRLFNTRSVDKSIYQAYGMLLGQGMNAYKIFE